jgi:hypothetical protein
MSSVVPSRPDGIVLTSWPSTASGVVPWAGRRRLEEPVGAGGLDAAGRHAVHANVQRAELHRELLAEHADRGVARAARVCSGIACWVVPVMLTMTPPPRRRMCGTGRLRDSGCSRGASVDRVHEGLVRQIDERPEGGGSSVVDEDLEAAQVLRPPARRRPAHPSRLRRSAGIGTIVLPVSRVIAAAGVLQRRFGAGADSDAHAFLGSLRATGAADALARAGD